MSKFIQSLIILIWAKLWINLIKSPMHRRLQMHSQWPSCKKFITGKTRRIFAIESISLLAFQIKIVQFKSLAWANYSNSWRKPHGTLSIQKLSQTLPNEREWVWGVDCCMAFADHNSFLAMWRNFDVILFCVIKYVENAGSVMKNITTWHLMTIHDKNYCDVLISHHNFPRDWRNTWLCLSCHFSSFSFHTLRVSLHFVLPTRPRLISVRNTILLNTSKEAYVLDCFNGVTLL